MSMAFDGGIANIDRGGVKGLSRIIETDLFGEPIVNGHKSVLAQTFEYPPFSVLNAREGWWQERKRQWLALGIQSELGRGGGLTLNSEQVTTQGLNFYRNLERARD